jgi:hypothetical protein
MRRTRGSGKLLAQAYEEGSLLYASAFDETELDWIFGAKDEALSSALEWTLFRFARYDFTTVKGDILTGIQRTSALILSAIETPSAAAEPTEAGGDSEPAMAQAS